jgi:hypothetical protein
MRAALAFALLAASSVGSAGCASRAPAGPAWPQRAAREDDGGESLAPRAAARAIAAVVEDDRPADRAADKPAPATTAGPAADKPGAGTAVMQDDPAIMEEIVIEVDDQ